MLLDRVDVKDKDVIDLACGSGYYTRVIRERVSPDHQVWGADISENMIKIAKKLGPDSITYVVQDCTEPLPDGK
jgi:ubiquinone/menaquinone biosynthesis C-methylase UbiE